MAKTRVIYECEKCGAQYPKWQGRCSECGAWNSLVEMLVDGGKQEARGKRLKAKLISVNEVEVRELERIQTGIGELDRVLGGGLVKGEMVFVAGEPGIGKSTLLTQLALQIGRFQIDKQKVPNQPKVNNKAKQKTVILDQKDKSDGLRFGTYNQRRTVIYVCGEESPGQVKMRLRRIVSDGRLAISDGRRVTSDGLKLLAETDVDVVVATLEKEKPNLVIVDSIQTLTTSDLTGVAGSVGQIRECSNRLIRYAKSSGVPVILVGHVTKSGEIAGPKILEHMVDCVLELSGDRYHELRLLRAVKNRFGATDEVGVFRMTEGGMEEVRNPSEVFLRERDEVGSGSAITVIMEGTRPVLVEVQALVVRSELPVPRRVAEGVSVKKLQVLCGVLQKHANLRLGERDVFVKITGGLNLKEPAVDLAMVMAIASSYKNKPLPKDAVAIGEVGLLGEIRGVTMYEKREKEAKKLGYKTIYSIKKWRRVRDLVNGL